MADTAAHLVDRVLPEVPVRQWVFTLPYPLRYRCAWNARLTSEGLRCFLRAVFADYRRRIEEGADRLAEDEPLLAMLTAASIRSRIATGPEAGAPWRRLGDRVDPDSDEQDEDGVEPGTRIPPRCVRNGGMSLHADVAVPARDRRRLERLCRYVARPPLALERLEEMHDGRLAYRLKTPWRDGTTHVAMEQTELLGRPRFFETRPSGPSRRSFRNSRSTCRRPSPSCSAAFAWVSRRSSTRPRISSRFSSLRLIVRVPRSSMSALQADTVGPGTRHL